LEAMLANLAHYAPNAELICICPNPATANARFGIRAIPVDLIPSADQQPADGLTHRLIHLGQRAFSEVDLWPTTAALLQEIDHLIIAGTGVLDDFGVRPWNLPYDLYKWCMLAGRKGTRLSFVSVGAGPIVQPLSRRLMLAALGRAGYRSYRDRLSADYLASVGFDTRRDHVVPDLAFSLPVESMPPSRVPADTPQTVGLGVMGYYGWRNSAKSGANTYATYLAKIKEFAVWLLLEGYTVHLLSGELPADERPRSEILEHLRRTVTDVGSARVVLPVINSTYELMGAIGATDVVVATRYHNVIAALMMNRPVLSIGYNRKNDVLLAAMGLGSYTQNIEMLDIDALKDQFGALVRSASVAQQSIQERVDSYRHALEEQYQRIFSA
jgi:polysaccharide pyruvyl transferase WcaK-like protein